MKLIKYLILLPLISFSQPAYVINNFEQQEKYIKHIYNEILIMRENPCEVSKRYKVDLCYLYSNVIKLKLHKKLNYDCYLYAKCLALTGRLEHSGRNVPGNESLARTDEGYKDVVYTLVNEFGYHDDAHRRHITGNSDTSFDDKIIGIGLYKDHRGRTFCVIRTMNYYQPIRYIASNESDEEED